MKKPEGKFGNEINSRDIVIMTQGTIRKLSSYDSLFPHAKNSLKWEPVYSPCLIWATNEPKKDIKED